MERSANWLRRKAILDMAWGTSQLVRSVVPRNDATLLDTVHAAHPIQAFIRDMMKGAWRNALKTRPAVPYQIPVIGKAVKQLLQGFRERHAILP